MGRPRPPEKERAKRAFAAPIAPSSRPVEFPAADALVRKGRISGFPASKRRARAA